MLYNNVYDRLSTKVNEGGGSLERSEEYRKGVLSGILVESAFRLLCVLGKRTEMEYSLYVESEDTYGGGREIGIVDG